jgi:hypothetical protein
VGNDTISVSNDKGLNSQIKIIVNNATNALPPATSTLTDLPGVISWKTLTKVSLGKEGLPEFSKDILDLNGKEVKLQGYMMPLENEEKQQHFLLTTSAPTCFYCLPAGAENVVEVYTSQEIPFSYDPLIVKGILEIIKGQEMGLYYRMKNAQRSAAN